ncbi:MAG: 4-(cytidine 5'-diphospho)-2-C-methyl-D-erythritol kinase [Ignavibacteria bacterium]
MFSKIIKSYAKINIGLRVLRKREDGFHDLETIFYPIKLFDEITFHIEPSKINSNSVRLKSNKAYIPLTKENICYKALELFFKTFYIKECYSIDLYLKKNIPVGGGLGGGSSNAATTIKALVNFFEIDIELNKKKILDLALSIGSDVPFFLMSKPCYAEGRGEKMSLLNNFNINYDILIVNPNLHVSTKWAFEKLNVKPPNIKKIILKDIKTFDISEKQIFINDFEDIVFSKFDILKKLKYEFLEMGAVYSSMSGTGATMYAFFERNNNTLLNICKDYYHEKQYFTFVSDY